MLGGVLLGVLEWRVDDEVKVYHMVVVLGFEVVETLDRWDNFFWELDIDELCESFVADEHYTASSEPCRVVRIPKPTNSL